MTVRSRGLSRSRTLAAGAIGAAALLYSCGAPRVPPLKRYNIDPGQITVSGVSSGADIAHQLHIAYSATIRGAGLVAGAPYGCALGNAYTALSVCTAFSPPFAGPPNIDYLAQLTHREAAARRIDDPANLADDRVYLFRGTNDRRVPESVMQGVRDYYAKIGIKPENILYINTVPAGHAMVTRDWGKACGVEASPYINHCGDLAPSTADVAGDLLSQLYDRIAKPDANTPTGSLLLFSQVEIIPDAARISLDDTGHIYVPKRCAQGARCKLHIAFHGCQQNDDQIGSAFYAHAGYNRWADANDIVVLYPQVERSGFLPFNPMGCWDWWGYAGTTDYYLRSGKQMAAVRAMIDRLVGDPGCVTADNPTHIASGRAHRCGWGWTACASGSKEDLGWNSGSVMTSVRKTASGAWVRTASCP